MVSNKQTGQEAGIQQNDHEQMLEQLPEQLAGQPQKQLQEGIGNLLLAQDHGLTDKVLQSQECESQHAVLMLLCVLNLMSRSASSTVSTTVFSSHLFSFLFAGLSSYPFLLSLLFDAL